MEWNARFARRTAWMKRSTVRELLKLTQQPGMISFAGGLPAPELFPVEALRQAADKVLSILGHKSLQYGETEGLEELRELIAQQYTRPHFKLNRQNVVIVSGSQQGLDLIGRILLDEGDCVLVENPTYLALISAWRTLGVRFISAPTNGPGVKVGHFRVNQNPAPKVIYQIPNFQNPQGTCLSPDQRQQWADGLRDSNAVLVEDDPYGELRYEGAALPSVLELNARMNGQGQLETNVIHTSTYSKVLAPGLRLGFVIAEEAVIDKIVMAKQSADLHTPTLNQYLLLEILRSGLLTRQIPLLRQAYRERRDAMLRALEQYFPLNTHWTRPAGGMFLMVTLPESIDANQVLQQALGQNVAFVPGEDFHVDGSGGNTFRLNFSFNSPEIIAEGIERLGRVIRSFTASTPHL